MRMEVPQVHPNNLLIHLEVIQHLHNKHPVTILVLSKVMDKVMTNKVTVNKVIAVLHSNLLQLLLPVILRDTHNKQHLRHMVVVEEVAHMVVTSDPSTPVCRGGSSQAN